MPVLSSFTPFCQLEFSSQPSEAEKIYRSMRASYRDPVSGAATIDTSVGTHKEAQLYGWALALGNARVALRAAGNELRPETSYATLEAHEAKFQVRPAPTDTVVMRRAVLAARQKAARGPRYEAVWEALTAIFGSLLIAYRPMTRAESVAYPADPALPASPGLFRRQDAIASSIRLTTAVARVNDVPATCDIYAAGNRNNDDAIDSINFSAIGQTFTGDGYTVVKARFSLWKSSTPTGSGYAKIYASNGTTIGDTAARPTGAALAVSDPFDVSTLTGATTVVDFTFSGANRPVLTKGAFYFVVFKGPAVVLGGASVNVGIDTSAPSHAGTSVLFNVSTSLWQSSSGEDICFEVLTEYATQVSYENWNTSHADVLIAAGDEICVEPDNWGVAERLVVLSAAGSGADRSLTAAFHRPHSAGTFATTGPVPLWANTRRHVLVVVTAAAAVDVGMVAKVNALFARVMRAPTTWAIVQPTTPGAATTGPFIIGTTLGSPLGAVPVESITL
jgi:hypothetical protein